MKQWWRTAVVTVLVVLTGLVAPVSVVLAWAHTQVSDTSAFVAAYAPLADEPAVQELVATTVSGAIQERLDLPGLTDQLVADLSGSNPRVARLLPSLTGPLNSVISDFIDRQVANFVASDAFAQVWQLSLRSSHAQLVALLNNDPSAPITLVDGLVRLQLAPIVTEVKERLIAAEFPLAAQLPPVDVTIDLVQLDATDVSRARAAYQLLGGLAEWVPWLLLLLPALALVAARNRRRTVIACAAAIAGGTALVWLILRGAVTRAAGLAAANGLPEEAIRTIAEGALSPMRGPALALVVLGLVVAGLAWLTGRAATAEG